MDKCASPIENERASLVEQSGLFRFAVFVSCLALLIAPFRSSAGFRGGLLLLALVAVVWCWRARGFPLFQFPAGRTVAAGPLRALAIALALWLGVVAVYALLGPQPTASMPTWRGDILTPVLTGLLFFALNREPRVAALVLCTLFAGLLVLTAMVIADPSQPLNFQHEPRYVSVGWLSTWVVLLASLLPLAWLVAWRHRRVALALAVVAALAMGCAAWFTSNRLVWLCFACMLVIYVAASGSLRTVSSPAVGSGQPAQTIRNSRLALLALLGGAGLLLALFFGASAQRHGEFAATAPNALSFMLQDNRFVIWRESLALIGERPLTGYGFALETGKAALADRFADPGFGRVFRHAHNILLNYAIQIGVIGPLLLLGVFGSITALFWRLRAAHPSARAVACCGLMLVLGFFVRNQFDDFISRHAILLFGALTGFLLAATQWPPAYFRHAHKT